MKKTFNQQPHRLISKNYKASKRNLKYTFPGLLCMVMLAITLASCSVERSLKQAEKHIALGEYYDAAAQYRKAYLKISPKERERRGQIAIKMARCYAKINETQRAIAAYKNAIRYKQVTVEDRLELGKQLLKNSSYKEATDEFKQVLDSFPDNILAKNGLLSAQKAPTIKELGSQYTVKKMGLFDAKGDNYSPVLTGDNYDRLYFTSTRNEAEGDELSGITGTKNGDIFVSSKDDKGQWQKPEPVTGGVNTAYDEGACCLSADQREMYLTQCTTNPNAARNAEIVVSNRADAAWGKADALPISRDTLSSYAHPAISPDGEWLYFTSDMPGGQGGLDLWRVRLIASGLGGVENLGAEINTPGDEEFPTFRPNGDLYFSSNGHPGMGGLDIFIAKITPQGQYKLEHPGYPLNSQGDDFGMTFEGPHNRGFFSSNRGNSRGWDNIYSFEYPEIVNTIKGWVYEADGYELPAAQVFMVGDDGTNLKLSVKGDGSFTQVVQPGVIYIILATCKGYLNHKEERTIKKTAQSEEEVIQFPLASISAPVLIDNIFYDFDKATLRPESKNALDGLVQLLNENPNVTIELSAHCDYKGSAAYNKQLSQRRAEAVSAYLTANGIAKERLTPMGYGKEKPKTVRKKLTEKYPWLHENDTLTASFIGKLDPEKQEICNQLNRRTEFLVLRTTYGLFDNKGNLKNPPKPTEPEKREEDDGNFIFE